MGDISPGSCGDSRRGADELAGRRLSSMTWAEVEEIAADSLLAVPLGSTEQHGPHLPLGTDTAVAVALAEGLARRLPSVVLAPALPYGSSGEHRGFAGTASIGAGALEVVVVELVRSLDAFAGVILVSGHGGNAVPLHAAVATLRAEGRTVLAWAPRIRGGDAHAGRTETSLLLSIWPGSVRTDLARAGDTRPIAELMPLLRQVGVRGVCSSGVLGDPAGANEAEGTALLDALEQDLEEAVMAWSTS